jgi:hypothetical protein
MLKGKHKKQSPLTLGNSFLCTTYTIHSKNTPVNPAGHNSCHSPSRLDVSPRDLESPWFSCILMWNLKTPFGAYKPSTSQDNTTRVPPVMSFYFEFACAHAQGILRTKTRQGPCPLSKMSGRNRLKGRHSISEKQYFVVNNSKIP